MGSEKTTRKEGPGGPPGEKRREAEKSERNATPPRPRRLWRDASDMKSLDFISPNKINQNWRQQTTTDRAVTRRRRVRPKCRQRRVVLFPPLE